MTTYDKIKVIRVWSPLFEHKERNNGLLYGCIYFNRRLTNTFTANWVYFDEMIEDAYRMVKGYAQMQVNSTELEEQEKTNDH